MSKTLTLVSPASVLYNLHVKSTVILIIALFLAQASLADNKAALDYIVSLAEQQPIKGRAPFVFRYNAKKFNTIREMIHLDREYNLRAQKSDSECRYDINFSRRKNISILKNETAIQNDPRIAFALKELYKNNQLAGLLSALWDGESGTPEECRVYEFNAYTIDGYKLTLEFK